MSGTPRSHPGRNATAASAGVSKPMRKGTKSCRSCRQRKTRCIYPESGHTSRCKECISRNLHCEPQGLVEHGAVAQHPAARSSTFGSNGSRPVSRSPAWRENPLQGSAGHADQLGRPAINAPSQLSNASLGSRQGGTSHHFPPSATADLESGQIVNGNAAPLITALGNPVLGATNRPSVNYAGSTHISSTKAAQLKQKYRIAAEELCSVIPSKAELQEIFQSCSSWWPLWRDCVDLEWGNPDTRYFHQFVTYALEDGHPALIATLLVGLAISTNDDQRFLPPVERWILNDDELASTEHGLRCLMALGLYRITTLQPRRAWTIYRRASTLVQLNGIHLTHRKNEKQGSIFWPLFHADRWVSLLIGLPYMLQDNLCDVKIPPINELPVDVWLYRKMALVGGRVIDCLQSIDGPTLSSALAVEEQLDALLAQLPPGYLDTREIRTVVDHRDKNTRLYRTFQFFQLRAYVHLPLLLRSSTQERYGFSRKSCVDDSRRVLEAYLEIHYQSDTVAAVYGGVVNFVAFISAVIMLLGLMGYGQQDANLRRQESTQRHDDCQMIHRVMHAIKTSGKGMSTALCGQCYTALAALIHSAQNIGTNVERTIVLPYFGAITISGRGTCREDKPQQDTVSHDSPKANKHLLSIAVPPHPRPPPSAPVQQEFVIDNNHDFNYVSLVYSGPFLSSDATGAWPTGHTDGMNTASSTWNGTIKSDDWSWLSSDLPPNFIY